MNELVSREYHAYVHTAATSLGYEFRGASDAWVHPIAHVAVVIVPVMLLVTMAYLAMAVVIGARSRARAVNRQVGAVPGLHFSLFRSVMRYTKGQQCVLVLLSLMSLPLLYASMEVPKQIINNVLNSSHFPIVIFSLKLDQSKFLFLLCILYLVVVLASARIKYLLNVAKGYVSERFGRRLRVLIYRKWCRDSTRERKAEIILIVGQEVEALGGFAGEVITLPLLQGGTLVTVILFMLMQDPLLGIAALTVAPVQIILLPRLQRRVNEQSRARLKKVRSLGVELGDQLVDSAVPKTRLRIIAGLFRDLENIRRRVYRMKFFNKALNNVLTSLTPFFFFSLGGYFVLQDRISLGALVAVLAAHKEFSSPMNELFAYYQMVEDTRLRYREVHHYFDRHSTRVAESGSADNPDTWGVLTVRS